MEGLATWPQIVAVTSLISGIALFAGGFVAWILVRDSANRQKIRNHYDERFSRFEEASHERLQASEKEIHALQMYNAGLAVVLKQLEGFQTRVDDRFNALHNERKEDMGKLYRKLDDILALSRINIQPGEYPKRGG